MTKTDKEVLELCKSWFEDIMERSDRLTSGNVAHGRAAIRGVAKSYAEFIAEHLKDRWKPSDEQMKALKEAVDEHFDIDGGALWHLYQELKNLKE